MNTYEPLQVKKDGEPAGYYHFTCSNDGRTWPVGYCQENKNDPEKCHHKTPEEASDCWRNYLKERRNGKAPGGFEMDTNWGTVITEYSSY